MNSSVTSVDSHIVDDDPEPTSPVIGIGNNWWSTILPSNTQSQPSPSVTGSVPDLEFLNWSCSLPVTTTVCDIAGQLRKTMVNTSNARADCHQQLGTPATAFTDSTLSGISSLGGVAENPVWGDQGCYLSCPGGEIMHGLQNCSVEGLQDLLYNTRVLRHHGGEFLLSDELQKKMEEMPMWDPAPKNFTFQGNGMNMAILEKPAPALQYSELVDDRSSRSTSTLPDAEHWSSAQEHHHCISQTDSETVFTSCSEMPNAVQFNRSCVKQEYPGSYGHSSPCTTIPYWNPVQGRHFAAEAYNSNRNCSQVVIDQSGNQPLFKIDPTLFEEHRPPLTAHAKLHAALLQQRFRPCQSSSPSAQMLAFGNSLRRSFSDITPFRPEVRQSQSHGTATSDRGFSLQYMQHRFEGKPLQGSVEIIRETPSDPKRVAGSMATCEAASDGYLKRPRVEPTPSLPFKQVRKEKLGDRITTLQQLVSPFGKTDTASVLFEAIEYIKFLQKQVQALSMPYMKSSCTSAHQNEPGKKSWLGDKSEHTDEPKQDLRSKGLCLVPLSCTIHVANDNGADYWTPAYGGAFR